MISDLLLYIVPVVAIIAGPILAWFAGKRSERSKMEHEAMSADVDRANQIEDQADEARRTRDTSAPVDDRLREHGRLRD